MEVDTLTIKVPKSETYRISELLTTSDVLEITLNDEVEIIPVAHQQSILRGIEDMKAGRYITNEALRERIAKKFEQWKK